MYEIDIHDRVIKFINSLETRTRKHTEELLDILAEFGHEVRMPYSRFISDGIFELRVRGQQEVRLFYKFKDGKIVIFYGFIKKVETIPRYELQNIKRLASLL